VDSTFGSLEEHAENCSLSFSKAICLIYCESSNRRQSNLLLQGDLDSFDKRESFRETTLNSDLSHFFTFERYLNYFDEEDNSFSESYFRTSDGISKFPF